MEVVDPVSRLGPREDPAWEYEQATVSDPIMCGAEATT